MFCRSHSGAIYPTRPRRFSDITSSLTLQAFGLRGPRLRSAVTCPCQSDPFDDHSEAVPALGHLIEAARERPELGGLIAEDPADYWKLPDGRWILVYGHDSDHLAILLNEGPAEPQVTAIVRIDAVQNAGQAVTEVLFQLDPAMIG